MSINTKMNIKQQSGTALIMTLLMLLVMTLIGVNSLSTSSMEERMAGNAQDRQKAFQAAEAALAFAEDFVRNNVNAKSVFTTSAGDHLYEQGQGPTSQNAYNASWWTGAASASHPGGIGTIYAAPRFTIELRGDVGNVDGTNINIGGYGETSGGGVITTFRVTARGQGQSPSSVVILVANYGKRI